MYLIFGERMDENSRNLPPASIGSGGVADIGAAMPSLTDPEGEVPSTSDGGKGPPSQQQQPEQPDIIMDPSPNRVKRFVFRSRKKSVGTGGDVQTPHQGSSSSLIEGGDDNNTEMDVLEVVVPEVNNYELIFFSIFFTKADI